FFWTPLAPGPASALLPPLALTLAFAAIASRKPLGSAGQTGTLKAGRTGQTSAGLAEELRPVT
ncbi:MAG: hypothetical protein QMA94_02440, partial [Aquiluna sp.]